MKYRLSKLAEQDIEIMLEGSLQRFGIEQTERYYRSLEQCLVLLGNESDIGISVDEIRKGYRKFPHQSHVIYYKRRRRDVFIVRVLHERMHERQHLKW